MSTSLRVLVMIRAATGTVSFLESSRPSPSIRDVRLLTVHAAEWRDWPPRGKALAVVVTATGHRPRLIPFVGCSESVQAAWVFGCWSIGLTPTALLLPEGRAGASML
jgi:hypothetical protein